MIEKKTIIDQIEVTRTGVVQVRFALVLLEDGAQLSLQYHRTIIEPGVDVDAQLAAVNADITTRPGLKAAPVDPAKVPLLKAICEAAQTPEVVRQYVTNLTSAALVHAESITAPTSQKV